MLIKTTPPEADEVVVVIAHMSGSSRRGTGADNRECFSCHFYRPTTGGDSAGSDTEGGGAPCW